MSIDISCVQRTQEEKARVSGHMAVTYTASAIAVLCELGSPELPGETARGAPARVGFREG